MILETKPVVDEQSASFRYVRPFCACVCPGFAGGPEVFPGQQSASWAAWRLR